MDHLQSSGPSIKCGCQLVYSGFYSIEILCSRRDSEEECSRPQDVRPRILSKLTPAKDIVSQDVKPDEDPPKFKLLTPKPVYMAKPFLHPKITVPQEVKLLRTSCNQWDSLMRYFGGRQSDLLYLRSNNQQRMRLQTNSKMVSYFAGYFEDISLSAHQKQNKPPSNLEPLVVTKRKKGYQLDLKACYFSAKSQVVFDSAFETGNLFAAFKVPNKAHEFQLVMQNDINSKGNTQWFHFKCLLPKGTYTFRIINYTKNDSLFAIGMKVTTHSAFAKVWGRQCTNITYSQSQVCKENTSSPYYTLQFQYTNPYESDVVTFANCYPLTYTQMINGIEKKLSKKSGLKKATKIVICKTFSGLDVIVLRIGDLIRQGQTQGNAPNNSNNKKSIVFIARQHPGETPGSLIMQGIMESLIKNSDFETLRKQFVIYLVPMLNPDGVVYGNYRTNLSGGDLNRKWRYPSRTLHPEVFYTRRFFGDINRQTPIALIIDLHGHSKKLNSFFYGNPSSQTNGTDTRLFPYLCSTKSNKISFLDSTFTVSQDKKNTARVVLNQMFPNALVYTFETSFYGYKSTGKTHEFTVEQYKSVGRTLLESYVQYLALRRSNTNLQGLVKQIAARRQDKEDNDDSGSDSDPEEDVIKQIKKWNNQSTDTTLACESTGRIRNFTTKKNSSNRLLKRLSAEVGPKVVMVDRATQTDIDNAGNMPATPKITQSRRQSQIVLQISQLKSSTPHHFRSSDTLLNSNRNTAQNIGAKKSKLFGASFTMKLWNKGLIHATQNQTEGPTESTKALSRGKK